MLNVDVHPANQTAAECAQPGLWEWISARRKEQRPDLLRGDIVFGNEKMMLEADRRKVPCSFRLRRTQGVERLLGELWRQGEWEPAGADGRAGEPSWNCKGGARRGKGLCCGGSWKRTWR